MRFYGGTSRDWLERTPAAVVRACRLMLPKLMAEEKLDAAAASGVGHRQAMQKRASGLQKALSSWQQTARGPAGGERRAAPTNLGAIGIGVRKAR
jgi:hypothetical protein